MPAPWTWDETVPAGTESRRLGDDRIREMKATLKEVFQAGPMSNFPTDANCTLGWPRILVVADTPNLPAAASPYNRLAWVTGGSAPGLYVERSTGWSKAANVGAASPISVNDLKKATGSRSGGNGAFTVNRYAFASPNTTAASSLGDMFMSIRTDASGRYWEISGMGSSSTTTVTWDYLTASGNPQVWASLDRRGGVAEIWESEDPPEPDFPDLPPIPGKVLRLEFPKQREIERLVRAGLIEKVRLPRWLRRYRGRWHKDPQALLAEMFADALAARGLPPFSDVREALASYRSDERRREWITQLWLRCVARVVGRRPEFSFLPGVVEDGWLVVKKGRIVPEV
jgi:hypothetical protein